MEDRIHSCAIYEEAGDTETLDVKERVMKILQTMDEEMEILAIRQEIQEKLQDCVNKHQREYVLRNR